MASEKGSTPLQSAWLCTSLSRSGTEAMVYQRIAGLPGGGVPTPELLYAGGEFLVLSVVEGTAWDRAADRLTRPAEAAARRELGAITARLHTLAPEDGRFGYPATQSGLLATDWRTAFTAMVEALLEDAERWQSALDAPPAEIRRLVAEGGDALDEVTEPRLVHFDLWPGNIFVDPADDGSHARITGLIDHERASGATRPPNWSRSPSAATSARTATSSPATPRRAEASTSARPSTTGWPSTSSTWACCWSSSADPAASAPSTSRSAAACSPTPSPASTPLRADRAPPSHGPTTSPSPSAPGPATSATAGGRTAAAVGRGPI